VESDFAKSLAAEETAEETAAADLPKKNFTVKID